MARVWPRHFLRQKALKTIYLGLVIVFFVAGFVQFNLVLNRGALAYALWAVAFAGSVYFYTWIGALVFVISAIFGSKMAFQKSRGDFE